MKVTNIFGMLEFPNKRKGAVFGAARFLHSVPHFCCLRVISSSQTLLSLSLKTF